MRTLKPIMGGNKMNKNPGELERGWGVGRMLSGLLTLTLVMGGMIGPFGGGAWAGETGEGALEVEVEQGDQEVQVAPEGSDSLEVTGAADGTAEGADDAGAVEGAGEPQSSGHFEEPSGQTEPVESPESPEPVEPVQSMQEPEPAPVENQGSEQGGEGETDPVTGAGAGEDHTGEGGPLNNRELQEDSEGAGEDGDPALQASQGKRRDGFISLGSRLFPQPSPQVEFLKVTDQQVGVFEMEGGYELFGDLLLVAGFRAHGIRGEGSGWTGRLSTYNFNLGARYQKYLFQDVILGYLKASAGLVTGSLSVTDRYGGRGYGESSGPSIEHNHALAASFDLGAGAEFLIPRRFWRAAENSLMKNFTAGVVVDVVRVISFPLEFDQVAPAWQVENGEGAPLNMGSFELSGWTTRVGLVIHF